MSLAKCWFCELEKEVDIGESTISLAFGMPCPVLRLTVRSYMVNDDEVVYFLCKGCRKGILRELADSKVVSQKPRFARVSG